MKRLHLFLGAFFAILLLSGTAQAAAPAAPDYVKLAWVNNLNQFLVRWFSVPDATSYNVYRYDTNTSAWVPVATNLAFDAWNVCSFRDPSAPGAGPATYGVTAVNNDGESTLSSASVVPGPDIGNNFTLNSSWWPVGYTFADPEFIGSYYEWGIDGMMEASLDGTNFTHSHWHTNISGGHHFHITNLMSSTRYYLRMTAIEPNDIGVTYNLFQSSIYTLPAPVFNVQEDVPNLIELGAQYSGVPVQIHTPPSHGTIEPGGFYLYWIYTPEPNFTGIDTFQILDNPDGPPVTVTMNVTNVNDFPVAAPFTIYVPEDSTTVFTPPVTDLENDAYFLIMASYVQHGDLFSLDSTNFIYTPHPNFIGTDEFMYYAEDTGWFGQESVRGLIIVTNVNDAPVANDMSVTAHAGSPYTWKLNGTDVDGDSWQAELITPSTAGSVTVSGAYFTYTPGPGEFYNDSFTYRVTDGQATSAVGTVSIFVAGPNTLPEATDQSVAVLEKHAESTWTLTATDPDSDPLQAYLVSAPTNGTVTFDGITALYRREVTNLGPDTFAYHVSDGSGTSSVAVVSIEVITNRPPIADPTSVTTAEDTPINIYVTATDPDGDVLTWEIVTPAAHGFLWNAPWFYYAPGGNYHGPDSFSFRAFDGRLYSDPVTVNITVTPVNDAPVRVTPPLSFLLAEDGFRDFDLVATDVDGDSLTYQIVTPPANGVITFRSPGGWTYRPNTNWFGSDSVSWRATDGQLFTTIGTVSFAVLPVNDAPAALPQTVTTTEDTALPITLQGTDPEGSPLTYTINSWVNNTLEGTAPNIVYRPPTNFFGTHSLTFFVKDGVLESAPATVTIIVTSVNDAPVAHNKSVSTAEDQSVAIALTGSDVENAALTFIVVDAPTHGTLAGGTYTPAANYSGADSFTYKARETGGLESAPATVSIDVTTVNDAPVADSKSATVSEDGSVAIALTGSDVEGVALNFTVVNAPQYGQYLDGVYTPNANYYGPDSFTYKANDGQLDSAPATVSITVTPVNDAPVADSKSVTTAEDQSVAIALTGSDIEGSALSFIVVNAPAHGTFANGVYTPAANYFGPDSFTYKANDGQADSAPATVSITVNSVNDAPVANNQSVSTPYNTAVNIVLTGSDVEGSALTYTTLTSPANGTLTGTGANRTFTPNIGWSGNTSFTFKVNDGALDSATATVTITVAGPGSVPAAPNGLTATAVSQNQINLAWNDNSANEDGFKIERSPNGNSSWVQIATVGRNVNTYSNTGLTKNTRYYYRVRAYNVLGNSAYSNTANARTLN